MTSDLSFAACRELARAVRRADMGREAIAVVRPRSGVSFFRSRAPLAISIYVAHREGLLAFDSHVGFALLRPHGRADRGVWQDGVSRGGLRMVDRHWDGVALLGPAAMGVLLAAASGTAGVLAGQAWLVWLSVLAGLAAMVWVTVLMAAGLLAALYRGLRAPRPTVQTFAEATLPSGTWSVPLSHANDPARADRLVALVRTHVHRLVRHRSAAAAAELDARVTAVETVASVMIYRRGITSTRGREVLASALGRQPLPGSDVFLLDPPDRDIGAVPWVVPATFFAWYVGGSAIVLAIAAWIVANGEQANCAPDGCAGRPATWPDALRWMLQRLWFQDPPGLTPATAAGTIIGWLASGVSATGIAVAVVSAVQVHRRHRFFQDRLERARSGMTNPEIVVLTALETEFAAVREYLTDVRERDVNGTLFDVGTFYGGQYVWTVAVTQLGAGGERAALQVERARTAFTPTYMVFCGVAGGRKDVRLGDVVAADVVYDYQTAKEEAEGIRSRFKTHYSADNLVQRAMAVARASQWQSTIRPEPPDPAPRAFVKPLAAGAKVLASHRANTAVLIDERAGDALAVEMEGFGFLDGAHLNPGLSAIVIRGISDLLDGKDEDNDERWQPIAARHAAAFMFAMFRDIRPR